jgi:alpha-tubulin suppressor-like RCC1 family protein/type II secretory pathway pseudopilin PulG
MKDARRAGFTLPTVLVASTVMIMVLLAGLQLSISASNALKSQYYNQLAREAAEAGVAKARECLELTGTATWSDASPLQPQTYCDGTASVLCPNDQCYVMKNDDLRTSFAVGAPVVGANGRLEYTVKSNVDLTRTGGAVWRTYNSSANYASMYSDLPRFSGGAGYEFADGLYPEHVAVIASIDNNLYGVGYNGGHQITNNLNPINVTSPTKIVLPSGVTSIKKITTSGMGTSIICIIGNNDQAYCRGQGMDFYDYPNWKQLTLPSGVANAYDVTVNGFGHDLVCVLAGATVATAQAYCMGMNDFGMLGINRSDMSTLTTSLSRFLLPGGMYAKKVVSHTQMTCVLTTTNRLYCAGRSEDSQIAGNAPSENVLSPQEYKLPSMGSISRTVKDFVIQYHADEGYAMAVLATDGTIWSSGARTNGITGNGSTSGDTSQNASRAPDLFGSGSSSGGAIKLGSASLCVDVPSQNFQNDQLLQVYSCNGSIAQQWMLLDVGAYKMIWSPASGGRCVDVPNGNAFHGQDVELYTCDNVSAQRWNIVVVNESSGAVEIHYAANPSLCLGKRASSAGLVLRDCTSSNTTDNQPSLHTFALDAQTYPWRGLIAMQDNFCGLRNDGTSGIWCSGRNNYGQLADGSACVNANGSTRNVSVPAGKQVDISKLSAEWQYQLAALQFITTDGRVYGAGRNVYGKLGNNSIGSPGSDYRQCATVEYQLPSGVKAMDLSTRDEFSTYVLGDDGNIYAAGLNNQGQLGNGTMINSTVPVPMKLERSNIIY